MDTDGLSSQSRSAFELIVRIHPTKEVILFVQMVLSIPFRLADKQTWGLRIVREMRTMASLSMLEVCSGSLVRITVYDCIDLIENVSI